MRCASVEGMDSKPTTNPEGKKMATLVRTDIEAEGIVSRLRSGDPSHFPYVLVDANGVIVDKNAYGKGTRWAYTQRAAAITNCIRSTQAIRPTYIATADGVYAVEG